MKSSPRAAQMPGGWPRHAWPGALLTLVVLAGALWADRAPLAELRPRSLTVELWSGYDTNLLDGSDAEIQSFETGDSNSFFVIRRIEDTFLDLRLEGRLEIGPVSDLRLGYERLQFVHESIRSEDRYALDWRTRPGSTTRLRAVLGYNPQIYGRHRRDKDALPGDPLFRAETHQRWDASLAMAREAGGGWQWESEIEGTIRDYCDSFDERDRWRVGAMAQVSKALSRGPRLSVGGGFRRNWSRNEPYLGSDLSYREWTIAPSLQNLRLSRHVQLRAYSQVEWREYTSNDPDDEDHFGRHDTEIELGAELLGPLAPRLAWRAAFTHRTREASLPGVADGSFDEEGSFSDNVASAGLVWTWDRKASGQ